MTTIDQVEQADIIPAEAELALGVGWYPLEGRGAAHFRWINNDAEMFVATVQPVPYVLKITLEPGPGVQLKPFDLAVFVGQRAISTTTVKGKQTISVPLPSTGPTVQRVRLHTDGGGNASPGDPRILNFRVFDAVVERGRRDVLPAMFTLGSGWYPLEHFGGASFRWVSNDAEIGISPGSESERITLDLEPGPGAGGKPLGLVVNGGDGKQIEKFDIVKRQTISVDVPPGTGGIRLHATAAGPATNIPGDSRTLNFRVFAPGSPG